MESLPGDFIPCPRRTKLFLQNVTYHCGWYRDASRSYPTAALCFQVHGSGIFTKMYVKLHIEATDQLGNWAIDTEIFAVHHC